MAKRIRDIELEISKKLKKLRVQKSMTQEELGMIIGTSAQQVQKYETGQNRISTGALIDIANALETPINFFFDDISEEFQYSTTSAAPHISLNESAIEYDSEVIDLTPDEINTLFKFYTQIKSKALRNSVIQIVKELSEKESTNK